MAEVSYLTGLTRTEVQGVSFTATFTTSNWRNKNNGVPGSSKGSGRIGSFRIGDSGSGYIQYTRTFEQRCYVSDAGTVRYTWSEIPSAAVLETANATLIGGQSISQTNFWQSIAYVQAVAQGVPGNPDVIEYLGGDSTSSITYSFYYMVGDAHVSVPVYGITVTGNGGCSANGTQVYAIAVPSISGGRDMYALYQRFEVFGWSQSSNFTTPGNRTYQPLYMIDLQVQNRYLRGGTIPSSEYTSTPYVLYEYNNSNVNGIAQLTPAESNGAVFAANFDRSYCSLSQQGFEKDPLPYLKGTTPQGFEFFYCAHTGNIDTIPAGSKRIPNNVVGFRLNASQVNPGFLYYSSLPTIDSGYSVNIGAVPSTTIQGTWAASGGTRTFTASAAYQICGYRWLLVTMNSALGAVVRIGDTTKTITPSGSATFAIDRYGDRACLSDLSSTSTYDSLGLDPITAIVVTGTATGGAVSGTHTAPDGYSPNISGAAIYFSNTNAAPTPTGSSNGKPHTLGRLCLFSGGCPGLRLADMTLQTMLNFFTANPACGMSITLASGSLTPATGTKEAAYLAAGLRLSSLNRGLPFWNATGAAMTVGLCFNVREIVFDKYAGDVLNNNGGEFGASTSIVYANTCPHAFFYTLSDGLQDTYQVQIKDSSGSAAGTTRVTGAMAADSFGFLVDDANIPFVKAIPNAVTEANSIDGNEIKRISTGIRDYGAFLPPT